MRSLHSYIIEDNIRSIDDMMNESLILTCLAGACLMHFGIKIGKKLSKAVQGVWHWMWCESLQEAKDEDKKVDISKVQILQIPDKKTLLHIIQQSKPVVPQGDKEGHGLYKLAKLLTANKELKNVGLGKEQPMYAGLIDKEKNIYGVFGFSSKHWISLVKDAKLGEFAKHHKKTLHIYCIDILPEYEMGDLIKPIIDIMPKLCKELKLYGTTIQYFDNDKDVLLKVGFKEVKNMDGILEYEFKG